MNLRDEILEKSGLVEMALADLKGVDLENASAEEVASSYIKAAKERGMDDKKIIAGLGSTFRAVGGPDSDKKTKMTADVAEVKAAVKKELGFEPKAKAPAKKKEEAPEEAPEEPTEESYRDIILQRSGLSETKMYCKSTDKMMSKSTDFKCKYCSEKFDTKKKLEKHLMGCGA